MHFADGNKVPSDSKHLVLDSGLSYTLVPSEDFSKLTELLSSKYGVTCKKGDKKDNFSA